MAGLVLVSGEVSDKAGTPVAVDAEIVLKATAALRLSVRETSWRTRCMMFGLSVAGMSRSDVGASTGGFVDCLLQSGASKVIALDVGRGQLDSRLRSDPRVACARQGERSLLSPGRSCHSSPIY